MNKKSDQKNFEFKSKLKALFYILLLVFVIYLSFYYIFEKRNLFSNGFTIRDIGLLFILFGFWKSMHLTGAAFRKLGLR